MAEYDYRFRNMTDYNYTHSTPTDWQAWHDAYFDRVGGVLRANGEWIRLLNSGRTMEGWAMPNCTRTCGNATAMFSSPENVWNCIALATVTMEVVRGNKTVHPDNLQRMDDIFDLGGSLEAFDKLHVFTSVQQCFWQSCSDSKYGRCAPGLQRFRCDRINSDNIGDFASVINRPYCRDAVLGIDSDIAGPGVLVAFMIQIGLVLIFAGLFWVTYLSSTPFETAVGSSKCPGGIQLASQQPSGSLLKDSSRAASIINRKTAGRFALAAHSTVSDLQEAQTAFGLTIGAIFLLAFCGRGTFGLANVTSVFSYTINRDIAYGLLAVGTCSVVFLQLCLQRVGKREKYKLAPMVISWILMSVAHGSESQGSWANPDGFLENLRENAAVEDCGNNPGPMSYCLGPALQGPDESQQFFDRTKRLIWAVHILFIIVLHEELKRHFDSKPSRIPTGELKYNTSWLNRWLRISARFAITNGPERRRRILHFSKLLATNLLGLITLVICLIDVVNAFKKIKKINADKQSWAFGQLVATAVWIPVVVRLVNYIIVGPEKGIEARIHSQLQVSRVGNVAVPSQEQPGDDSDEAQSLPLLA
ncbi:hypothetical protein EDB81DRAFT_918697 [Dactylonectria macrodidyma]|uniref:Uncharacterized protein n=1 Tax=Dactylonectria macrodidyma TaxID=307937 RepID=A0A9P9FLR7_9HYPO|nr:hypothetical protein EDB81DRAFT_918697 [Dactylonectria macrodidyma]